MNHVKEVIEGQLVEEYHCWVDSTTVLYWIKGHGTWSQFVRNSTEVIQDKQYLKWHHVPTKDNPSEERETEGTIDNIRNTRSREVLDSPGPGISGYQVRRGTEEG